MTDTPEKPIAPNPADLLPPVEPPSAGFIVQLFVIPAVIVAIILVVWALFNWLAHMGNDPRNYVQALRRNNESRWQEAFNLSNELNKSGNDELKHDAVLARDLANMLNAEIEEGSYDDKPIKLRFYLARVLGEFQVPDVLPTLIKAVETDRDDREVDVRLAALQALARFIPNNQAATSQDAALRNALLAASRDDDPVVRYHAAYTLGVLGDFAALARLHVLLDDANPDVRMNAAKGLARNGDVQGVPVLTTMLDPNDESVVLGEKDPKSQDIKRLSVQYNTLETIDLFVQKNGAFDRQPLIAAVDKLIASNPQADIRAKAEETKRILGEPATQR